MERSSSRVLDSESGSNTYKWHVLTSLQQKKKSKGPRKPRYAGASLPNRFAIPPGYRWDGVGGSPSSNRSVHANVWCFSLDRSTGFEKKYFQYQNAAVRKEYESNQWSVEDM